MTGIRLRCFVYTARSHGTIAALHDVLKNVVIAGVPHCPATVRHRPAAPTLCMSWTTGATKAATYFSDAARTIAVFTRAINQLQPLS